MPNESLRRRVVALVALLVLGGMAGGAQAQALRTPGFEPPPELQRDVDFWKRIYSDITTGAGLLHDDRNLSVVYEVIVFPEGLNREGRSRMVESARAKYVRILRTLAEGRREGLSDEEARVLALWGPNTLDRTLELAVDRIRFQLGQRDRFIEGLVRSGRWEDHLARSFAERGLPPELAALPHVESSFNPMAGSKVGAAGLWQFMPSTGRRWLRVDNVVDERYDPYKSTVAAAQFLQLNHRILGTWPLALTAYNHGAGGMRRAKEMMGTDDIATILRYYTSPTFGFASRNFYVSFLAALEVDRNQERYLGPIQREPLEDTVIVPLRDYVPVTALTRVLEVDRDTLRSLNLSLRGPVWNGQRSVPRGFELRVPAKAADPALRLAALKPAERRETQGGEAFHTVRRGDTLGGIAKKHGVSTDWLVRNNKLRKGGKVLQVGQVLRLPGTAKKAPGLARADEEATELLAEERAAASEPRRARAEEAQPLVTAEQGDGGTVPVAGAVSADPTDYSVWSDGTIMVAGAETLGHFADWLEVRTQRLRDLNGMKPGQALSLGRRIKLDLGTVNATEFERRRRAYHRQLQEQFFTSWRVVSTERLTVRPGETLWGLTQKRGNVPVWLLRQYNPDVNLENLKPGTELTWPTLEAVGAPAG